MSHILKLRLRYAQSCLFLTNSNSKQHLTILTHSQIKQEMSLKKTISGVCKRHLDLFLIPFVQVYMKLKGTNKHQR